MAAPGRRAVVSWGPAPLEIGLTLDYRRLASFWRAQGQHALLWLGLLLSAVSITAFTGFYLNGLGLAYNDARSHLDIARRVVEGLKTGFAQLGSVWLPLPHVSMLPFVWNNFMWHSGLAGALGSMASYVLTGLLIYRFLDVLGVGSLGKITGVVIFASNLNILYLQSTAMTEPMLMATMTAAAYELLRWAQTEPLLPLLKAAFWALLATLVRYDGWFLLAMMAGIVFILTLRHGYKKAESRVVLFSTLGGFGVLLWLGWNQLIFGDALYFAFGPYSAHAQQDQMAAAGVLATKHNLLLSTSLYMQATAYNSIALILFLGLIGGVVLWFDRRARLGEKVALLALWAPGIFNILALYLGFSVIFIQGYSGQTWFNVRYGSLLEPAVAVFVGYLIHRINWTRAPLLPIVLLAILVSWRSLDAVTIDDARVGASQKNVSEITSALHQRAAGAHGLILVAAASHDAIIFSSDLPMNRFIHEGTGAYWDEAMVEPDQLARWIVMRTNDVNDQTFKHLKDTPGLQKYDLVASYPFADLYDIKPEYREHLEEVGARLEQQTSGVNSIETGAEHAWLSGYGWLAGHVPMLEQSHGA